jgi:hypothetical protein
MSIEDKKTERKRPQQKKKKKKKAKPMKKRPVEEKSSTSLREFREILDVFEDDDIIIEEPF